MIRNINIDSVFFQEVSKQTVKIFYRYITRERLAKVKVPFRSRWKEP